MGLFLLNKITSSTLVLSMNIGTVTSQIAVNNVTQANHNEGGGAM